MKITFYNNQSDRIVLNKNITKIGSTHNVKYKDDTDTLNPNFYVAIDNFPNTMCNYIYIHQPSGIVQDIEKMVNRYYFVNDVTFSQGYAILHCEVDVLMSFKDEIENIKCIVGRNSKNWNMYLNDDRLEILNQRRVLTFPFPKGFRSMYSSQKKASFILTLSGSGTEITPPNE